MTKNLIPDFIQRWLLDSVRIPTEMDHPDEDAQTLLQVCTEMLIERHQTSIQSVDIE